MLLSKYLYKKYATYEDMVIMIRLGNILIDPGIFSHNKFLNIDNDMFAYLQKTFPKYADILTNKMLQIIDYRSETFEYIYVNAKCPIDFSYNIFTVDNSPDHYSAMLDVINIHGLRDCDIDNFIKVYYNEYMADRLSVDLCKRLIVYIDEYQLRNDDPRYNNLFRDSVQRLSKCISHKEMIGVLLKLEKEGHRGYIVNTIKNSMDEDSIKLIIDKFGTKYLEGIDREIKLRLFPYEYLFDNRLFDGIIEHHLDEIKWEELNYRDSNELIERLLCHHKYEKLEQVITSDYYDILPAQDMLFDTTMALMNYIVDSENYMKLLLSRYGAQLFQNVLWADEGIECIQKIINKCPTRHQRRLLYDRFGASLFNKNRDCEESLKQKIIFSELVGVRMICYIDLHEIKYSREYIRKCGKLGITLGCTGIHEVSILINENYPWIYDYKNLLPHNFYMLFTRGTPGVPMGTVYPPLEKAYNKKMNKEIGRTNEYSILSDIVILCTID